MSLVNVYLSQTPLTSTENKFLGGDELSSSLTEAYSLKRKLKSELSTLNSLTQNKFLLDECLLQEDAVPKKKKKKLKQMKLHRGKLIAKRSAVIHRPNRCEMPARELSREIPARELSGGMAAYDLLLEQFNSSDELAAGPLSGEPFGSSESLCGPRLFGMVPQPTLASSNMFGQAFGGAPRSVIRRTCMKGVQAKDVTDSFRMAETIIMQMPTYNLDVIDLHKEAEYEFLSLYYDESTSEKSLANVKGKKMQLLNVVSMALMFSSNLKDKDDKYRIILQKSVNVVRLIDPEYILKVALYARQELQIRSVTNFLLACAAFHHNTRIYLEKYFDAAIVLPTDWIQVAEYYETLNEGEQRQFLPAALRRVMKESFQKFDPYQLAKYNRDKKKTHKKDQVSKDKEKDDDQDKDTEDVADNSCRKANTAAVKTYTLKQLIRSLHIDSPSEHVMCILGKKYPKNYEDFKTYGFSGSWDSTKAGTRMKLPVPETWETQISANGNKPTVWESLIDNKKLPYMATLRNLKNLILSGISPVHHKKVINYIENKKSVINSRQLPMQYFEAYKVITRIQTIVEGKLKDQLSGKVPHWKKAQLKKMNERIQNASVPVCEQYKGAISKALEISSMNNLHPIPGKTLVICQIGSEQISNKLKNYETCIMMGLMCLKACEDCKMSILCCSKVPDIITLKEDDMFLDIMMNTCEKYEKLLSGTSNFSEDIGVAALENVLQFYLKPQIILSLKLDHIVLLETSPGVEAVMSSFLNKYRQLVNPDLLYTNVNFNLSSHSFCEEFASDKDVYLCGTSSSLIKFIAERSTGGQVSYIDNIDMKYDLPSISESKYDISCLNDSESLEEPNQAVATPLNYRLPKWHTVRIFVSSTFKDMMSERDLLIRYVFPELKRRAASVFVRIAEIDLRWGITEADSSTKRAAELCLIEAQNADLFIGLIGERYGTIYNFESPDSTDLEWVNDFSGLSITELEMHAAALRHPGSSHGKAFFYFRNNSFVSHVPKTWTSYFYSEDFGSKAKVDALKNNIRSNKFKVLDGYPCHWVGIFENKPVLAGLDVLGNTIVDDLWKAIQEVNETDPHSDSICEEEVYQQNLIQSKTFFVSQKNFVLEDIITKNKSEEGIFVLHGSAGSGKTTFLIRLLNLLEELNSYVVVKFFIGISPRSRDLSYMIMHICQSICNQLSISMPLPNLPADIVNEFPDILLEATNCSGGRGIFLIIDGLDYLENDAQRLDWLPLVLPKRLKLICSVSESSLAFDVLCKRQKHGSLIHFRELPSLLQSDREQLVRNYLSYYRKTIDESAFSNHMLKIVTKKDSCYPNFLRIVCDFLRIYATFENLVTMIQKLPSSIMMLFQEIILQMENEFGSTLVQSILTLLCITKEGLEDVDLHYILSFIIHMNELKFIPPFQELKENITSLKPEKLLSRVKYCSLMHVISTFAYGQMRPISFNLVGTEFEKAIEKFYLNKNFVSYSKNMHCILAAYYHNMCDVNNDGKYQGKAGFGVRNLLYHMFHGCLYKELCDLLCNHTFLEAVFSTHADDNILEYYSALLYDILPNNQKLGREIDHLCLFAFYDFISRNFHIFHKYPQLLKQQALNEPMDSLVKLKVDECQYYSLENLSHESVIDCRLATLSGFVKNITASASENMKPFAILGTEDGYFKVFELSTRKVVRTIKGHASTITCICFVGKNQMCVSSVDGTLSLWNTDDFCRTFVLKGHRHNVTSCCSDPSGGILYSSGWDNSVRLWSLVDGREISVIDDFRCPVNCIDHHPVKQQIACGLWNGNIEIWDTISMQKKLVLSNYSGSVQSLAYTPDGINIVSSYIQSEICIWSSEEGLKISNLKGHILPVKALSYSTEDIFVSGSDDCTLKVWPTTHRSQFTSVTESKFCPVSLMEFMSANLLAVAFQNSEIWVLDINSGVVISKMNLDSDVVSVFSNYTFMNVNLNEDADNAKENLLIFGTQSGKLMIHDLLSSAISEVTKLNSKITAIVHNCEIIFCGTAEGDIGMFSYPENKLSKVIHGAHEGFIGSFCLTRQFSELFLFSTANDNVLQQWSVDCDNFNLTLVLDMFNKHRDTITYSLSYPLSSGSKRSKLHIEKKVTCDIVDSSAELISDDDDDDDEGGWIRMIYKKERRNKKSKLSDPDEDLDSMEKDSMRNLLTGSHDNDIISWNKTDSHTVFHGLQSSVVKISCSGDYILGCGNDGALVMWFKNGTILTSIPGIEQSSTLLTFYVAEDVSDKFAVALAYIDLDGSIKINKPLQQKYSCSFDGHSRPITSCCISENGEVVSCSLDGSVNLWKIPQDIPDNNFIHDSEITGLLLSSSMEFALSSDAHGNLILWEIRLYLNSPMLYAGKKTYDGGFIRALSWLKDNSFACAVSQQATNNPLYFLNIMHFNSSSQTNALSLMVKKSYYFESEVLCLDTCDKTDLMVVGLKSGDVICITSEAQKLVKMCNDWVLKLCLFTREKASDLFCTSFIDGHIKLFSVDDFMSSKYDSLEPFGVYKPPSSYNGSKFASAMCSGDNKLICCGDSDGILKIYVQHSLKFIKKVHNGLISGMCVLGSYLFTSSLDKTVKGWNLKSFKQVCQFHSHAPISCLSSLKPGLEVPEESSYLVIGTTSGNVHLLKFHCK